jgi:hypothetical protein
MEKTDEDIAKEINTLFTMFGIVYGWAYVRKPDSRHKRANMKYRLHWSRWVYNEISPLAPIGVWIPDWNVSLLAGKYVQKFKEYSGWNNRRYKK